MSTEGAVIEVIKWIRESVRPVLVLLVLSALALFIPHSWLSSIGIADWLQKYQPWAILFFAGSLIWLGTFPIEQWYYSNRRRAHLQILTPDQKEVLRIFVANNKTTQAFSRSNLAIARNLAKLKILTESEVLDGAHPFFLMQSKLLSYLREHSDLVGIRKE